MHDPMTVAFELHLPWGMKHVTGKDGRILFSSRPLFITIWHCDPERHGDDDSCDWGNRKRPLNAPERALAEASWDMATILDNAPHYPDSREHLAWRPLHKAINAILSQPSRTHWWQLHPRWHVHHWRIQVHPLQDLKRWLFSRCAGCGKRFAYGYSPCTTQWHGTGPRWFRSETYTYHSECVPAPVYREPFEAVPAEVLTQEMTPQAPGEAVN